MAKRKLAAAPLLTLATLVVALSLSLIALQSRVSLSSRADAITCDGISPTPFFTNYYGYSTPSTLLPVGAFVEAFSPRGERVGCFEVNSEGRYGFMRIWGDDSSIGGDLPGMREGEIPHFRVNGVDVFTSTQAPWTSDYYIHNVSLLAEDLPGTSPTITTTTLAVGQVGNAYHTLITGQDVDLDQTLTLTASNLPSPLSLSCSTTVTSQRLGARQLTCKISGTPTRATSVLVDLVMTDSVGRSTSKILELRVN